MHSYKLWFQNPQRSVNVTEEKKELEGPEIHIGNTPEKTINVFGMNHRLWRISQAVETIYFPGYFKHWSASDNSCLWWQTGAWDWWMGTHARSISGEYFLSTLINLTCLLYQVTSFGVLHYNLLKLPAHSTKRSMEHPVLAIHPSPYLWNWQFPHGTKWGWTEKHLEKKQKCPAETAKAL